ncbi:MAG: hypothetical protein U1F76_28275 [Candidatus Competibacteraceae bacterium]
MLPADVRNRLIDALRVDLVGPALPDELLDQNPTRWYLTGFLAPLNASLEQRSDLDANDEPDLLDEAPIPGDDSVTPDRPAARTAHFPALLGLSVLVTADTPTLHVQLDWGDYQRLPPPPVAVEGETTADLDTEVPEQWQRLPRTAILTLHLPPPGQGTRFQQPIPADARLKLACNVRPLPASTDERLPPGARVVSVFLSNERGEAPTAAQRDEHYVFQPVLTVDSPVPFLPQPNLRGRDPTGDWDERVYSLHYRNIHEYAVGHGVATTALHPPVNPATACAPSGFCRPPSNSSRRPRFPVWN